MRYGFLGLPKTSQNCLNDERKKTLEEKKGLYIFLLES
jgi:hypothetical protein